MSITLFSEIKEELAILDTVIETLKNEIAALRTMKLTITPTQVEVIINYLVASAPEVCEILLYSCEEHIAMIGRKARYDIYPTIRACKSTIEELFQKYPTCPEQFKAAEEAFNEAVEVIADLVATQSLSDPKIETLHLIQEAAYNRPMIGR